jgi:hypothetical protein
MASVTDWLAEVLEHEAPSWGIRPVGISLRRLSGLDLAVLWGDLSVGLLLLVAAALLVPALGLPSALLAIAIGSVVGSVPLALVGFAGAREGVPGMVLFRPALGLRGSYLPSAANLVQLVGWTAFEFWAMGRVANAVSRDVLGVDSPIAWMAIVAVVCTALASPDRSSRCAGGSSASACGWWRPWRCGSRPGAAGRRPRGHLVAPGTGGFVLGAVDLVIAMPVS